MGLVYDVYRITSTQFVGDDNAEYSIAIHSDSHAYGAAYGLRIHNRWIQKRR